MPICLFAYFPLFVFISFFFYMMNCRTNCAHFGSKIGKPVSGDYHSTKSSLYSSSDQNYGEWFDWTDRITWNADELSPDNVHFVLYIYGVEADVDISLSTFRITLPDVTYYSDPADLCGELILNGNAEGNIFNPYPMRKYHSEDRLPIVIQEEDGNRFYRMEGRTYHSSSMYSNIHIECLETGVTYQASAKLRIHSELSKESHFLLMGNGPDGSRFYRTFLECLPIDNTDGWVTCSGEFMVDKEVADGA